MSSRFRYFVSKITGVISRTTRYGCITYCILEFIGDISICSGPSMQPTLYTGDIVISEFISIRNYRFNYGDIVVSKSLSDPKQFICKRITGLPGDKMKMNFAKYQYVPMGHVWLEGDNRDFSSDSRDYGPVPQGLIRGRVICRVWPLKDITMLTVRAE
ncbi:mitochondrial inner membrane protease subunit 1 [Planococcus citri]|uniref:mitochondrial inner membrane protease subunit 1 n=1 Tax=Planococcus citri TaxID=170843 RepID=UPI0031F9E806